ncbi:LysM peptidoglycan-binding domain-containing protein [Anaerotignum sp.]|uniref:LysM peptidoglycan-binding domain-containing protein n=1 Tax=Anaerotignum sp. TaxID=2039241 RepID=UPI00331B9C90
MNQSMQKKMVRNSKMIREKVFLLLTLTMIISLGTFAMAAQKDKKREIYFESVAIHYGDTLWKIAGIYKAEDQKIEHMISEIMELNGMCSENIRSGESIIVPMVKKG